MSKAIGDRTRGCASNGQTGTGRASRGPSLVIVFCLAVGAAGTCLLDSPPAYAQVYEPYRSTACFGDFGHIPDYLDLPVDRSTQGSGTGAGEAYSAGSATPDGITNADSTGTATADATVNSQASSRKVPLVHVQSVFSYRSRPIVFVDRSGRLLENTVQHQLALGLQGDVRLWKLLRASVELGWMMNRQISSARTGLDDGGMLDMTVALPIGPIDIRLGSADGDVTSRTGGSLGTHAALTVVPYLTLPTGARKQFLGYGTPSGGVKFGYRVIVTRYVELGAALGIAYEPATDLRKGALAFEFAGGVAVPLVDGKYGVGLEYLGNVRLAGVPDSHGLQGFAWVQIRPVTIKVAAGGSFVGGVGTSPASLDVSIVARF